MNIENIISWIVVGGVAGWLASFLLKGEGMGLVTNIIVGIIGAFIGGWIFSSFSGMDVTGINITSIVVATIGALVLLFVLRLFRRA